MSRGPTPPEEPDATVLRPARAKNPAGRLAVGALLNGIYEVRRYIGRGGMGEVYEGANVNTDERVAIKVILQHLDADPQIAALLRREANTLVSLSHPALVQYRVFAQEPAVDVFYMVTEFVDGPSLDKVFGEMRPDDDQVRALIQRLAGGLGAAHANGVIHRDISPDNILLPGGKLSAAKIIDFGIAKDLDATGQSIVGTGFAGKFNFAAPEQFGDFDRTIGPWTDVYSLGLVMLALVRGEPADMGETFVDAIDRRRAGPDLSTAPPGLRPLFSRMLAADPKARLRSMDEVIAALEPEAPPARSRVPTPEPVRPSVEPSARPAGGLFISYSRADRAVVDDLVRGLRMLGVDVWWDEDMPGVDWQAELERQITELGGVVVIWTDASRASKNVRDEARLALSFEKLVNVVVGVAQPPFPFDRVNALPLDGWRLGAPHKGWTRIVQTIEALLVSGSAAKAGDLTGALRAHEQEAAAREWAVEAAREALQDAEFQAARAKAAADEAATHAAQAEQQLKAVVNFGASTAILKTAQTELEAATRGRDQTEDAQLEAAAAVTQAARALRRAEASLAALLSGDAGPQPQTVPPTATRTLTDAPPSPPPPAPPQAVTADPELAPPPATPAPPTPQAVSQTPQPKTDPTPAGAPATPAAAIAAVKPPPKRLGVLAIVGLLVLGIVILSVILLILVGLAAPDAPAPPPSPPATDQTTAAPGATPATPSTPAEPPTAAQTGIAALEGAWTPKGQSCDAPARVTVGGGYINIDFGREQSRARIEGLSADGVVKATADDGEYGYTANASFLTITDPRGDITVLTRCAG